MSYDIIQLKVEDHDNFIYIIADKQSREAAVVDPAWDSVGILEVLAEEALKLSAILITHSHHDHVNAVSELYNEQVSLFISTEEYPHWPNCPQDAILVEDGDEILLGQTNIGVILTPGHTPGGCCYQLNNDLISGDTLFIYGCGRADLKGGDVGKLYHSLQKLKKLPPQTNVWVGHDYSVSETTTLAQQLKHNPFLMIDNEADFARFRLSLNSKYRSQPFAPVSEAALASMLADNGSAPE